MFKIVSVNRNKINKESKIIMPSKVSNKVTSKVKPNKGQKNITKSDPRIKRKRKESYGTYIYKVLKQVHPDTGISSKAMLIMNCLVNDLKHFFWHNTTSDRQSLVGKFKLQFDYCCPVNWLSTPSVKVLRL